MQPALETVRPVLRITECNFYYRDCPMTYSFDSLAELIKYIEEQLIPHTYAVGLDWWGVLLPRTFKLEAYMPNNKTLGGRWLADARSPRFALDGRQYNRDMADLVDWGKRHGLI